MIKYRSLVAPALLHAIHNILSFIVFNIFS
jgi:hypothetical protein